MAFSRNAFFEKQKIILKNEISFYVTITFFKIFFNSMQAWTAI